jgi:MoaA/NifB/PqqE/SkfB family radical SAM enzyme
MKRLYFASLPDCNEDCLFCVRRGNEAPIEFMDTQKAKEILLRKRKDGYEEIYFDGGEPTLRNDLKELIEFAKNTGYKSVNVLTNGVLLADEKLVKELLAVKSNDDFSFSFSVSLHSHKQKISEKLTNSKNTFSKTMIGIKNLIRNGARNVSLYHVITKYNYGDLPSFANFVHKKFPRVRNITFSFIYPAGAALKNMAIFPRLSEVEPHFLEAAKLLKQYGINLSLSTCGTVPLCFLRGYEDVLLLQQGLDQPEKVGLVDAKKDVQYQLASQEFHQKTKVKTEKCRECAYDNKCGGLWKNYVKIYGVNELKPIFKREGGIVKKPTVMLLLTGFSCNNNCIFCSNVADRSFNSSTRELLDKIKQGYRDGFRIIEFIGGEVTIRSDFLELLSRARQTGFKDVRLTSNGRLFSYPGFAENAARLGLTAVGISLYGHNRILHDSVTRSPGSFEQCLAGIKNILKTGQISLIVNTVVSKINYKFLPKIGEFISGLGIKEWRPLELLPDGRGARVYDALAVPYGKLSPYLKKAAELAGDKLTRIDFFDFPFCLFDGKTLNNKNMHLFTPKQRFEDIEMRGHDEPFRIKKTVRRGRIIYRDKYKVKTDFCEKCIHFDNCGGMAKPHYDRYKDSQIKKLAIKHHFINAHERT